ncbi:hypothetical protein HRbin30_00739 [bacterium HR30]|nr:hypothetical protein HRbin30_00739 [bacterium HR30]
MSIYYGGSRAAAGLGADGYVSVAQRGAAMELV